MKKPLGFSLLELLVAIAVLAIIAAFAFPNFQTLVQNNRQTARLNDLITTLSLARSEAVNYGFQVSVCTSTNGAACNGTNDPNWHRGWMVFLDGDDDDAPDDPGVDVIPGADVVRVYEGFEGTETFTGAANRGVVKFRASGFLRSGNQSITMCDARGAQDAKALIISQTGRPRVDTKDGSGNPLTCP